MVFEYRGNAQTPGPLGQIPGAPGGRVPGPLRSGPKDEPGKGNTATKASKTTTPGQGDGTSDALNEKVAKIAEGYVGKPSVGDGQCYALADAIAKAAGAKTASDFVKVTKSRDQDYPWGKPITLDQVKRGDQLQFRNHKMVIETTITVTKGGKVIERSPKPSIEVYSRVPQHTATVTHVNPDGSFTVAEQHVIDRDTGKESDTVHGENKVYYKNRTLPPEIKTRTENDVEIVTTIEKKIIVSGKILPYRPQEDPKHKKDLDFQ
ncbi:MAG: hypothetical protein ABSF15_08905 [Candidatus Sulfotelmatobacter sp.]|jgi:hypothetical protein